MTQEYLNDMNWPNLIHSAAQGDQHALESLYLSTYREVYRTVRAMIREEDTVLDVIQDSYMKAFQNLDRLENPNAFPGWIKRIAANQAKDWIKKKKPLLFTDLDTEESEFVPDLKERDVQNLPEESLDQKETTRLVDEILFSLSDEQRMSVILFYYDQLGVKEIAQLMECSENTVKSRLNYGRKKIKEKVLELEKQGTKLYSLSPIPFLLWLLRGQENMVCSTAAAGIAELLQSGVTAGVAGGATGASTAASAAAQTAKTSAAVMGKKLAANTISAAAKSTAGKIAAGVLAVTIVGGGAAAVVQSRNSEVPQNETPTTAIVETAVPEETLIPEEPPAKTAEDYVITVYEERPSDDASDTAQTVTYAYPKILLESEDVEAANLEMYTYGSMLADRSNETWSPPGTVSGYDAWIYDDMLVVYLRQDDTTTYDVYENAIEAIDSYVYVLDIKTGDRLNRDELLSRMGYRGNAREKTREILALHHYEMNIGWIPEDDEPISREDIELFGGVEAKREFFTEAFSISKQLTISAENIDNNVLYYPTEDGSVRMVARMYCISGTEGTVSNFDLLFLSCEELDLIPAAEDLLEINEAAHKAYDDLLRRGVTDSSMTIYYYTCMDVDQDGGDELIVADNKATPDAWTSSELYTYRDGKLVFCGTNSARYDYLYYVIRARQKQPIWAQLESPI